MQFDVPTATLVVGFMYLLLPTSVFVFLREQRNPAVWFWCVGGVLNGIGFMTIVLRGGLW